MKRGTPLVEAVKEFGRILVLALLPTVVAALESGELFTKAVIMSLAVAALRALDAYLHQRKDIKVNGLVPF